KSEANYLLQLTAAGVSSNLKFRRTFASTGQCGLTRRRLPDVAVQDLAGQLVAGAEAGDLAAVRALLDAGADPNVPDAEDKGALRTAARAGHRAVVRLLLERGADPNWAEPHEFRTPLMAAAVHGHGDIIRMLVEGGAQVDESDDYGDTALCIAAS